MATKKYTLQELVEQWGKDPRHLTLGSSLVMRCNGCGGEKQVWNPTTGQVIKDTRLAYELALLICGNQSARGSLPFNVPRPCDCAAVLKELRRKVREDMGVVDLGKWEQDVGTSIPRRGIHDYNRKMVFGRPLDPEEQKIICRWLERDDCPGWTGVHFVNPAPMVVSPAIMGTGTSYHYTLRTTFDSSD